jgi:phosphate transport system substrate-binding protein
MKEYADGLCQPNITGLPGIGSSGAIKTVPQGGIGIGLSSRPLKASETRGCAVSVEYARSPTLLAVSDKVTFDEIRIDQFIDIYTGKLTTWPDGSLIRPIIRQPGDDNTLQLKALSPTVTISMKH